MHLCSSVYWPVVFFFCGIFVRFWYWLYVAWQAHLSMEFSRQDYWSGLPCTTPGDLSNPRIKPVSPASAGVFCINCVAWEGFTDLQGHNFNLCSCHLMDIFPLGLYVITWHSSLGVLVSVCSPLLLFLLLLLLLF